MDGFKILMTTLVQQVQLYQEMLDISKAQVELCRQLTRMMVHWMVCCR